jgi:phosphoglycolate phosphatase
MTALRALLFDLDGTLIDTAPEIAAALNRTLQWLNRPLATPEQVRGWIGDGARALLDKALGEPSSDDVWAYFAYQYNDCCGTTSRLYPGTPAMLERLRAGGVRLALLTNKEAAFAHKLLARHGITACFDVLVGGDSLPFRKPDPRVVAHVLESLQVSADEAAFVGDSVVDVRTARAAGLRCWAVRHGYPAGEFIGADTPDAFIDGFETFDPAAAGLLRPIGLNAS